MWSRSRRRPQLGKENRPLLWVELVIFSIIPGLFFHAWLTSVVMLSMLSWLITRPNGMFYMIFAISLIWSCMPFCIGYAWGGWIWAVVLWVMAFLWGIKLHINGLKWYWDEVIYKSDDTIEWKKFGWSGCYSGRQPLGTN